MIKQVVNKWNGKVYNVIAFKDKKVTLEREDGSQFTIEISEYNFTYKEVR